MKKRCDCPIGCVICGAELKRDSVGHYCPTRNCQYQHGYKGCLEDKFGKGPAEHFIELRLRAEKAELDRAEARKEIARMREEYERTVGEATSAYRKKLDEIAKIQAVVDTYQPQLVRLLAVVEAARYIGTEHSGICAKIACNCVGNAKRKVDLANALAKLDQETNG